MKRRQKLTWRMIEKQLPHWYQGILTIKNKAHRDLWIFVLMSGISWTEARHMRWQQIDIEQSTVRVGKRSIAIGEPILQMLSNGAIIADRVGLVFPGRNMGKALSNNSTEYRLACELSGVRWDARDVCAISKVVLKKLGHDYQQVFGCTSISEQERIAVNAADNEIMRMLGFPELTAMWVIPGLTSSEEKKIFGTSPCVLLDDAIDLIMEGAADAFLDMSYLMKLSTVFEH